MSNKVYRTAPKKEGLTSTITVLDKILIDNGYIKDGIYYFYVKDHLGNNRIVVNQGGCSIQKTHYYPFGMPFAEGEGQSVQPYKYGGKEFDTMHGLNQYDFHARQYDPAIARFTSIDPHAERYYSISPYVYTANNPLKYIDPTGMDSINVNGKGVITGVYQNNGNNRFFDKDGNELIFNDILGVDKNLQTDDFSNSVGDQLFIDITKKEILQAIGYTPGLKLNAWIYATRHLGLSYILTAIASHRGADFTHSSLSILYNKKANSDLHKGDDLFRGSFTEPGAYFRIQGEKTIYNLYDAGNFMWGAWTKMVGMSNLEAIGGSNLNEILSGGDSGADQRAIKNGRSWFNRSFKR